VARWQAVGLQVDASQDLWPYAALTAGESMLRLRLWQEAHSLLDEALLGRPKLPLSVECHRLAMRGRLGLMEGRFDLARESIAEALDFASELRDLGEAYWPPIHYAHLRGVELALAREQYEEVERLVESYLSDEELYAKEPLLRAELLLDCGTAQEQREIDAPRVERRSHATLVRASEELRAVAPSDERDRLLCRVELTLARLELAGGNLETSGRRLAETSSLLGDVWRGGTLSERALLARLEAQHALARRADRTTLERVREELAKAFEGRVAQLSRLPETPGGLGLLHYVELRAPLLELADLDLALEGDEVGSAHALDRVLELQALGSLARSLRAPAPTSSEVQRTLLAEDRGLLLFLPTDRRSLVFVVDRERVKCEPTAGLNLMELSLGRYRGQLLAGLPREAEARAAALAEERRLAAELAKQLFPPAVIERAHTWRGVTVSGLDVLGPVPLGWLPLGDVRHLGLSLAWDNLPSIPFGVARARADRGMDRAPRGELLLVGGVEPSEAALHTDAELTALPLSDSTVGALTRSYEQHAELRGKDATVARVLAEAPRYDVLQMLVHAIQDPSRTPPTGLVLTSEGEDSGVLWADTVRAGQFAGGALRLAMLASCRSAEGPLRRGDAGSADLAGLWLAAGVPAVLVSHSELTWGPMVEISQAFHAHLRSEGCSPAEALRRALAEREVDDERELPFRYGALEVVGLGQHSIFARAAR
jgi:hypothetical protein